MIAAIVLALTASAAGNFDWSVRQNRQTVDGALRNFARQCSNFGFTQAGSVDAALMEKKIYAHLLLKDSYSANAEVMRWGKLVREMNRLDDEDFVNSAAQSAGDALAAAALDPTVREAARERYIQSYVTALTPLFEACQSASREPFLSAHYVAGQGTLDWARRTGEEHWANSSGELAK
jgi:nucleoside-diphosphate-sugar epimerase